MPAPTESREDTTTDGETEQRPDLRLVSDSTEHDDATVLDTDGNPAVPQAPLDVRLRETAIRYLHGIPAFGQSPASFAESIEYSQTGDWATSESTAKRAVHGLATILAYLITYPLVDLLGKARTKPGPFLVAVAIGVCLINVAALAT